MVAMTLDVDLARLFAYEFWADREVLAVLRAAGERTPPRAPAIMNHILAAAHLWLTRMTGEKIKVDVWPALSIEQMAHRIDSLESAWRKWIASADAASLDQKIAYINSLGESWTSTAREILTHIIIHAGYHRGQIAILLGQAGQKPAYTDFIHAARQKKV